MEFSILVFSRYLVFLPVPLPLGPLNLIASKECDSQQLSSS